MEPETQTPHMETPAPEQKKGGAMGVAQAIIVAAVIVGAALIIAFGPKGETPKDTVTLTGSNGTGQTPTLTFSADDPKEHVLGDRNADVFLIEYSDIDCPFCRKFYPVLTQIMEAYGNKIAWVYRQYPLEGLHPNAFVKAKATECVDMLAGNDAFWKYLDTLFTTDVSPDALADTAVATVGVDKDAFTACMGGTEAEDRIKEDIASAQAAGAGGTPYSIVVNVKTKDQATIPGSVEFSQAKTLIDSVMK